jgi:hypothetical protein
LLRDEQIAMNNTTKALTGTRYYSYNGAVLAVRNGGTAPSYLIADWPGTGEIAIDPDNATTVKTVTRRQYTPFGEACRWAAGRQHPVGYHYAGRRFTVRLDQGLLHRPEQRSSDAGQLGQFRV